MAAGITVTSLPDGEFRVDVVDGAATTRHVVTVPDDLAVRVGAPAIDRAELVRRSFLFLLDREPATSILARFDLEVIGRYFPEYVDVLRSQLA